MSFCGSMGTGVPAGGTAFETFFVGLRGGFFAGALVARFGLFVPALFFAEFRVLWLKHYVPGHI